MVRLSASSIKSLTTCSWLFYYNYHLRGPQDTNEKTVIGSAIHEFYEVLSKKRHKKLVDEFINNQILSENKVLYSFTVRILKKYNLSFDKWIKDFENLIIAGLSDDFYQKDSIESYDPEYEFTLTSKDYIVRGFIDKYAKFEGDRIKIFDYKSQAKMFTEEEISSNIQAQIYQLAIYKETGLPSDVHFKLLRHNKTQVVEWVGIEAIKGLESYLNYLADYLKDFNQDKAMSNFAANDKDKRWLCGFAKSKNQLKKDGNPYWSCPARWPKTIYYIKDNKGEIRYSTDKIEEIKLVEGETFEAMNYGGCANFYPEKYRE